MKKMIMPGWGWGVGGGEKKRKIEKKVQER